jgi:hypothetical protein
MVLLPDGRLEILTAKFLHGVDQVGQRERADRHCGRSGSGSMQTAKSTERSRSWS